MIIEFFLPNAFFSIINAVNKMQRISDRFAINKSKILLGYSGASTFYCGDIYYSYNLSSYNLVFLSKI